MTIQHQQVLSLSDAEAMHAFGAKLGRSLSAGSAILLEGDLGTGKTTFIQGLGEGLGIDEAIVSPTFTLINEYLGGRLPLYHFDLYRLQPGEVETLQPEIYWEGVEFEPGIVAIEWADRLDYFPANFVRIRLRYGDNESRQAEVTVKGNVNWEGNGGREGNRQPATGNRGIGE